MLGLNRMANKLATSNKGMPLSVAAANCHKALEEQREWGRRAGMKKARDVILGNFAMTNAKKIWQRHFAFMLNAELKELIRKHKAREKRGAYNDLRRPVAR